MQHVVSVVVTGNVHIDFPELGALVAYLEGGQQKQIDSLTEEVTALTTSLETSRAGLQGSVDAANK